MKKITIASYTPFLKDVDDVILKKYLTNSGNQVEIKSWDDEDYNWEAADLVIIRSTWDYYKKIDEYIAWLNFLKEKNVFVLNDVDVILDNIRKEKQIKWIKEKKLSIPETYTFSKYDDDCLYPEDTLIKTLKKYYGKDVDKKMFVLKSSISAYTEKVYLVDPYNINKDKNCKITRDYETAFNEMLNKGETKKLIIQEYLEGIKDGEYGLVFINQKFTWAVVKKTGRIYGEESMIHIYKKDIPKEILNYAQKVAKLYDEDKVLYCRVDLVVSNNKTYLMEIELAEPDLYIRIGDHIDINVENPDYYLPLVERKGCKSVRLKKICEAIEEKIEKKECKYVDDYESAKYYDTLPRFSNEVYDCLEKNLNLKKSIVADVGSGTGRIAIDLLERGSTVYAIDPDKNMSCICDKKCKKYNKKYHSIAGKDICMNIPDNSVNFVISSQSYHRFNLPLFKKECKRVLKRNGKILIIWYRIDFKNKIYSQMLLNVKKYFKGYETRYGSLSEIDGAVLEEKENIEAAIDFFDNKYELNEVMSYAHISKNEFINLGLSMAIFPITHSLNTVTKIINSEEFDKENYISNLEKIFKENAKDNKIELPFRVQIISNKGEL